MMAAHGTGGARWLPRRTLRTHLTLLYAVPFFISGTVLLAIPLAGSVQSAPVNSSVPGGTGPHHALDSRHYVLVASGIGLAVMAVVSLAVGWLIAGRFLRPLRTITATARDISATNLHRRLGPTGHDDEFAELATTLDDLFARLEASFESQRHFVANASHELRTPLTAERALLQVALADREATTETLRSTCRDLLALGQTQERLIDGLLTLATSERGIERREPVDLTGIAEKVTAERDSEASRRQIHVERSFAPAMAVGDPSLVESMVVNLVDNALRHNVADGQVWVTTGEPDGRARITVTNTGADIPPAQVDRLFAPFQQLGEARVRHAEGHGLGLAIVAAIARAHDATLAVRPRGAGGLHVDVEFPGGRSGSEPAI
jgi:signal transduction histidine kinase